MFSLSFAKLFFYLYIKPMVIIPTTIITYGYNSKLGSIPESPSSRVSTQDCLGCPAMHAEGASSQQS